MLKDHHSAFHHRDPVDLYRNVALLRSELVASWHRSMMLKRVSIVYINGCFPFLLTRESSKRDPPPASMIYVALRSGPGSDSSAGGQAHPAAHLPPTPVPMTNALSACCMLEDINLSLYLYERIRLEHSVVYDYMHTEWFQSVQ